jgi:DNA-binding NarL/FixJ family response regulator
LPEDTFVMMRQTPLVAHPHLAEITTVAAARAATSLPAELIRIVVADEHALYRDGLRVLLSAQPDFCVIGEAAGGTQALAMVRDLQPDVLLLAATMSEPSAFEVLETLHAASATVHTILLASTLTHQSVVTAIQRGARGIFLKDAAADLLFKSVRLVHDGQLWINHDAVAALVDAVSRSRDTSSRPSRRVTSA